MLNKKLFTGLSVATLLFAASCKKEKAETTVLISTSSITNITGATRNDPVSATGGGDLEVVGSEGITERGVVWGLDPKPTTANNKSVASGSGKGNFSANLSGLTFGKDYYVRAYVINNGETFYGNQVKFTASVPIQLIRNGDFELPSDPSVVTINDVPDWKTDETDNGWIGRGTDSRNPTQYAWAYNQAQSFYQLVGTVPSEKSDYAISFRGNYDWTEWGDGYETNIGVIFSVYTGNDPTTRVPIDTVIIKTGGFPGWGDNWTGKSGSFSIPAASTYAGKNLVIEFDVLPYVDETGTYDDGVWYNFDNISVIQTIK